MMGDSTLTAMSIADAAAAIRRRELSPVALTEAYLERVGRLQPKVNAYITVTPERARREAAQAGTEIAAGRYRGPLHGIPLAVKDLFDTADIPTTAGSKFLAGRVPAADATAVRKLGDAGAILLGKLNTHEFAYGATTNNPHFGPTRNPWDLDRIPGGSSGGSGSAVAARMAAGALGTDTGGSVRIPAALCGVVGLKPTFGRVSKAGVIPLSFLYDHPGPLGRTVEDTAILLQAIAGYDAADFATVPVPVPDYRAALARGVAGLRIAIVRNFFFDALEPAVHEAIAAAIALFAGLGAELRDIEIPEVAASSSMFRYVVAEAKEYHESVLGVPPASYGPDVARIMSAPYPGGKEIAAALRATHAAAAAMRLALDEVDLLLTPTAAIAAPEVGAETVTVAGQAVNVGVLARLTTPFDASHLPTLSVPCGFSDDGLPLALQLSGRPFDEATVLRAGHAYERAAGWYRRLAPID